MAKRVTITEIICHEMHDPEGKAGTRTGYGNQFYKVKIKSRVKLSCGHTKRMNREARRGEGTLCDKCEPK